MLEKQIRHHQSCDLRRERGGGDKGDGGWGQGGDGLVKGGDAGDGVM